MPLLVHFWPSPRPAGGELRQQPGQSVALTVGAAAAAAAVAVAVVVVVGVVVVVVVVVVGVVVVVVVAMKIINGDGRVSSLAGPDTVSQNKTMLKSDTLKYTALNEHPLK